MLSLDETGHVEITTPLCRWCEKPLNGSSKDGMHQNCFEELLEAMDQTDDDRPTLQAQR